MVVIKLIRRGQGVDMDHLVMKFVQLFSERLRCMSFSHCWSLVNILASERYQIVRKSLRRSIIGNLGFAKGQMMR